MERRRAKDTGRTPTTSKTPGASEISSVRPDYRESEKGKDKKKKSSSSASFRPWLLFTPKSDRKMRSNHNMLITMIPVMLLFGFLIAYLVQFLLFKSEKTVASPYNRRMTEAGKEVIRGDIVTKDGVVLAHTEVDKEKNEYRTYPEGSKYFHVVGYASRGMSGLELTQNFELLTPHQALSDKIEKEVFGGGKSRGNTVVTTLDSVIQNRAWKSMKEWGIKKGAVVALEPDTGRVLAMVSLPDYDPEAIDADWDQIIADEGSSVLLNRTVSGLYPPGSTYKTVVALEYLRENPDPENFSYDCKDGSEVIASVKMSCYDGQETHGRIGFEEAYAESCNKAFANMAVGLNMPEFVKLNQKLLFNESIDFDLPVKKSRFKLTRHSQKSQIPQAAIGQGETEITPLHNALIMSAVANDGVLMKPFLVDKIVDSQGNTVKSTKPREYDTLMSGAEARKMQKLARAVVEYGTASKLKDAGYRACGKTGTADVHKKTPHSWFVGYAGKSEDKADIVVCVIAENSGSGSKVAVPIAGEIFDEYFSR